MPDYVIQGCTIQDSADVARNNMTAFWQDPNWRIVWKNSTLSRVIQGCTDRSPRNLLKERELLRQFKAVDPETGEFLGYARWRLPPGSQDKEDGRPMWREGQVPDVTPEERAKIEEVADAADWHPDDEADELDAPITRRKIEYLAKKEYLVLDFFAVHPENQGRGVGKALLKHGIEKAREMNMDIFVLGMAAGFQIYKRMGFTVMEKVVQDATRYGGNDNYAFQFLEYEIRKGD
ncbi:acetyltransferase [Diaporthe helianthi]|uniref:Acetyltransferase n=1 Tax=Diaporthe helianthi TaxID=158607 RepID=A0A2P5HT93_DIAHE|nr:acetyltransferase [Diaporthe helianthi]